VERRRSERTPVVVRIEYETVDALFSEFTRNINEGGVFVETDTPASLDSVVQLQFQLPGSRVPLKVDGRVVRVVPDGTDEPPGMGVEFEDLTDQDRAHIDVLVQQLRGA
jgi:uncharacterized protein (TIGR02266 family)